jgi:hypothetical protein
LARLSRAQVVQFAPSFTTARDFLATVLWLQ